VINRVVLVGRLTRDPELRTTTTGKNVTSFSIAVDKRFKREGEPDADFFRITAWGSTADFVSNYLTKGRLVAVDGRLETRKFTDKDGNNREVTEVVAENVQGLDRPRDDAGGGQRQAPAAAGNAPAAAVPSADEYDPFADE
jgi:single-strand DNA-binding protein